MPILRLNMSYFSQRAAILQYSQPFFASMLRCNYSTNAQTSMSSAESLLDSLMNYEQQGIPQNAGVLGSQLFSLDRVKRLFGELGNPHQKIPAVHVAGSKGKGSTSLLIASILQKSGYKVGLYTSPHLYHISERISVPGSTPISKEDFNALVWKHWPLIEGFREANPELTHFEVITALAYRHFVDVNVDVAVVEVGLGGVSDATNVIPAEKLATAVITSLGYEHVEALGGTIESIAAAKAGIMKPGRPVVVAHQQYPAALRVLDETGKQLGCTLVEAEQAVQVSAEPPVICEGTSTSYHIARQTLHLTRNPAAVGLSTAAAIGSSAPVTVTAAMLGRAAQMTVATAVTAAMVLREQGWKIPDEAELQAIGEAFMPCRMQVSNTPTHWPLGTYVLLDGAHTRDSADLLTETAQQLFPGRPIVLLLAMAADKDHAGVMEALVPLAPKVLLLTSTLIGGSSARSAPPGVLMQHWQMAVARVAPQRSRQLVVASMGAALERARMELTAMQPPGVLIVTGSLHAAAAAAKGLQLTGHQES